MVRGAWQVMVHRVSKSWTQLKQLSMHARMEKCEKQLDSNIIRNLCKPSFYVIEIKSEEKINLK